MSDVVLAGLEKSSRTHAQLMTKPTQLPRVSVCMATYNHEKVIAQAIESVMMQETSFEYELIIGEDCSTDGTRGIVANYQQRYPDRIRAFLRERNLGAAENWMQALAASRGEYVADLDGDDYWTDPLKLQRQADYLDSHPECSMCFHNVQVKQDGSNELSPPVYGEEMRSFYELADLIPKNIIIPCTVVFRKDALVIPLPDWVARMPMGDWPICLLLAQRGRLGYLPMVMSVYREHPGGTWSTMERGQRIEKIIQALELIQRHLPCTLPRLTERIATLRREAIGGLIERGDYQAASRHALRLLNHPFVCCCRDEKAFLKIILRGYCPRLWQIARTVKHGHRL